MGTLPDFLPGYQSVDDAQARKNFEGRWGEQLPVTVGLTALEMVEMAMLISSTTPDTKEGPRAWVEKREPKWTAE